MVKGGSQPLQRASLFEPCGFSPGRARQVRRETGLHSFPSFLAFPSLPSSEQVEKPVLILLEDTPPVELDLKLGRIYLTSGNPSEQLVEPRPRGSGEATVHPQQSALGKLRHVAAERRHG